MVRTCGRPAARARRTPVGPLGTANQVLTRSKLRRASRALPLRTPMGQKDSMESIDAVALASRPQTGARTRRTPFTLSSGARSAAPEVRTVTSWSAARASAMSRVATPPPPPRGGYS